MKPLYAAGATPEACLTSVTCPAVQRLQAAAHKERAEYVHTLVRRLVDRLTALRRGRLQGEPCC
jgi:hypothetical protein